MKLQSWLLENNLSYTAAASLFGCSRPAVYYYCIGRMRPGARICENITRETDGAVTADDHQLTYLDARK